MSEGLCQHHQSPTIVEIEGKARCVDCYREGKLSFLSPEQVTNAVRTERALRDWIRYGDSWADFDPRVGKYWADVTEEEVVEMTALMRMAVEGAR